MLHRLALPATVAVLTLVAFGLRVWGAGWSLPYVDHPDEPIIMTVILRVVGGNLNTEHFFYPSLVIYLQALGLWLHFWWGGITGLYPPDFVPPAEHHFYTTIPAAFVWARVVTALLGTAAVLVLATWGRRLLTPTAALATAVLLALSPWAIVHSHYITVDGPAGALAMLAVLGAVAVLRNGSWQAYMLAGTLAGLATGAKYQNVLVVVALAVAHVAYWRRASLMQGIRLAAAGAIAATVFFLTTPYVLLDWAGFMADMQTLLDAYSTPKGDIGRAFPLDRYSTFIWWEGLTPVGTLLTLAGGIYLWQRARALLLVLLVFPVLLLLVLLRQESHFYRNLLPAVLPLLFIAGYGVVALHELVPRLPSRWQSLGTAVLVGGGILLLTAPAVVAADRFGWHDARVVAQEWLRRNHPGVRVAAELSHPMQWDGVTQSDNLHFLPLRSAAWYTEQGYGLLLANAGRRGKDDWSQQYEPLLTEVTPIFSVGGRDARYLGPRMDVLAPTLTTAAIDRPRTLDTPATLGPLTLLGVNHGVLQNNESGAAFTAAPVPAGGTLALAAYWQTAAPAPPDDYMVFVHLRDATNVTVAQRDAPPWLGLFPPPTWQPGRILTERLDMPLPATLAPGEYALVMGLYHAQTGARFAAVQEDTRLPGDEVVVGRVTVVPPAP